MASSGKGWPDMIIRTRLQGLTYRYQNIKPVGKQRYDRASPLSAQAEVGNVYMVDGPWIAGVPHLGEKALGERIFPDGGHDDQIDAVSAGYNWLVQSGILEPFETAPADQAVLLYRGCSSWCVWLPGQANLGMTNRLRGQNNF